MDAASGRGGGIQRMNAEVARGVFQNAVLGALCFAAPAFVSRPAGDVQMSSSLGTLSHTQFVPVGAFQVARFRFLHPVYAAYATSTATWTGSGGCKRECGPTEKDPGSQ